jgi:hypothetical protein
MTKRDLRKRTKQKNKKTFSSDAAAKQVNGIAKRRSGMAEKTELHAKGFESAVNALRRAFLALCYFLVVVGVSVVALVAIVVSIIEEGFPTFAQIRIFFWEYSLGIGALGGAAGLAKILVDNKQAKAAKELSN